MTITAETIDAWANDPRGPVALHLKQKLVSVEGENAVIFPPTYADIGYNIDTLSDGTKVATIDSVGSQANRMEPIFKESPEGQPKNRLAKLVPQIEIEIEIKKKGEENTKKTVSIFDVGHRLADALVRCSELAEKTKTAFGSLQNGDAGPMARLAPTSLVFGVWDSRGEGMKVPRLVNSVIRAWDVEPLKRSAQYTPPVNYAELEVFGEKEKEKAEGDPKSPLAKRGFVHVPSTGDPGGVIAKGGIYRDVTVNLVALRRLDSTGQGEKLRQYILGLTLVAATEPQDGFLRQGCLLTPDPEHAAQWELVHRDGKREKVEISATDALNYATNNAEAFEIGEGRSVTFDKNLAKKDVTEAKKDNKKKDT